MPYQDKASSYDEIATPLNTRKNDIEEEKPLFSLEQVLLHIQLKDGLHHLHVENNRMFFILESSVYKIDLQNPTEVHHFTLPLGLSINKCWVHPNGDHMIVQCHGQTYYYLHNSYRNFKVLLKFKNINIKHIAFPNNLLSDTTGEFLIATEDQIYVGLIKAHDPENENKKDDKYIKNVFKLSQEIKGLVFSNNGLQINLVVRGNLLVWDCFDYTYYELVKVFKTIPKSTIISNIDSVSCLDSNGKEYVYYIDKTKEIYSNDTEILLAQCEKLSLKENVSPFIIFSEHHLLLIDKTYSKLIIVNKLSNSTEELELNKYIELGEKIIGITADYSAGTYWLYSKSNIYELLIENESISVWYNYYKMGKYEEALKCIGDKGSPFKKDLVLLKEGYDYLQRGGFGFEFQDQIISQDLLDLQVKGIKTLAHLSEPFEKVCLMLLNLKSITQSNGILNINAEKLLIEYLLVKFQMAKELEKNKIRMIILSSWIVELILSTMYRLESSLNSALNQDSNDSPTKRDLSRLDEQFKSFLKINFKTFDPNTIYQIMKDLNYNSKLIYFAELMEDYEFILDYYIENENWSSSLRTLFTIYNSTKSMDIVYKRATILLINYPKATVDMWLSLPDIDPEKFLPSILTYNKINHSIPVTENYSLKYMQKVLYEKNFKSKAFSNYYLSILITYPTSDLSSQKRITAQITKFLNHIKLESSKKHQLYDSNFILRLCLENKHYQPAILILINDMGLFEQALKLALDNELTNLGESILMKFDKTSAINGTHGVSNSVNNSDDTSGKINLGEENFSPKKKLWLIFAKYLIDGVCQGKKFDLLEEFEDKSEVSTKDSKIENGNDNLNLKSDSIQDITNGIVESIVPNKNQIIPDVVLKQLNMALKYLIKNSHINFLTLKDLLPIFPQNVNVSNFKEEIVNSLNLYNSKISELSATMNQSLSISQNLKKQIKENNQLSLKGKMLTIIEPGEPCRLCGQLLINKSFICFPNCHHNFHKECLIKHYLRTNYKFKRFFQNFKTSSTNLNKEEMDDILLKECILCNSSNINSLDNNLIDINLESNYIEEWEL